jgi:gliding motility-associated-like protein
MIKLYKYILWILTGSAATVFAAGNDPSLINYIKNKGQWDTRALYEANFNGGKIFLEKNAFLYVFNQKDGFESMHPHANSLQTNASGTYTFTFHAVRMEFEGSLPNVKTEEQNPASFYHNYYTGNDPAKWASNVPLCQTVLYKDLYNGISVKTFSDKNNVRYDFLVNAGANPNQIKLKFIGQNKLSIKEGNLIIGTAVGDITQQIPYAYQEVNGEKQKVECKYKLTEDNTVSFEITGNYDHTKILVIDPTLVFATYTGSTSDNWGMSATYDNLGNGYTTGISFGTGYPITTGAFQQIWAGGVNNATYNYLNGFDIVASKFNPSGSNLLFSTFLGGNDNEQPQSIICDNSNNLVIYGRSYSINFPVKAGCYDVSLNGGSDIIITKFNGTGTALLASTFIGGSQDDGVNYSGQETVRGSLKYNYADDGRGDIILDNNDNVYIASCTKSTNFPITGGCFQNVNKGMQDGCVFKMDPNLTTLNWSTYLGGNANDAAYNLAVDNNNSVFVTGGTESSNFPTTAGALHPAYMGNIDGFLTHLSPTGSAVLQSTYIGTPSYDQSYFVQLDNVFNVYIYGQSGGAYPVTAGVYSNPNSGQFIHCFNNTLSSTVFSTVFGSGRGTPDIAPSAFLVDKCQNIYISGWGGTLFGYNIGSSSTVGMPLTGNAFQSTTDGSDFYFFVLQKHAAALWYATYFGGTAGSEEHVDGGTSRFDKSGVIYQAICESCGGYQDMPASPGAWSISNNSTNCNNALVKFDFNLLQTVASLAISPSTAAGCAPFAVNFTNQSQNALSFSWYFGDGDSATTVNAAHTYTATGSYTVALVAHDSLSCNTIDTIFATITVYPQPTLTVNSATICAGVTTTLTTSGASTYTWSTGAHTASISSSPPNTTNYTVTGTDIHSCVNTTTTSITVHPLPVVTTVGSTTICAGNTATLTANGASTYLWNTSATTSSITVTPAITTQYTVTGTDINNCTDTATATVTVNAMSPLIVNSPAICIGATATLVVSGANTYTWNTGATTPSIIQSPGATTNYTVTGTNISGCVNSATTSIIVNPLPTITATKDTICAGVNATLNAGGAVTYTWSSGNIGQVVTLAPNISTNYTVTGTDANSCVNTTTTSIVVNLTPTLTLTGDTICVGETATLTAGGAASYTWSTSATTNTIQVSPMVTTQYVVTGYNGICTASKATYVVVEVNNTQIVATNTAICTGGNITLSTQVPYAVYNWNTGQTSPSIQVFSAGTFIVNTINKWGCPGADTIQIREYSPVGLPMPDTAICEGQSAPLQEISGPYIYNWHPSNTLNHNNIYNPIATPLTTTTYTVKITNGPCITTNTVTVHVNPTPHLTVTPDSYDLLPGEQITMHAYSRDSVFWFPSYGLSCINCPNPNVNTDDDITYMAVSGDPLTGCIDTAYVKIIVEGSFYVPNTFTPNKDGLNDVFKPVCTHVYDYTMIIYDRWGNHLFTTTDVELGWDGHYKGQLCQEDVYVYKIEYSQKHTKNKAMLKGHINLVR